MYVSRKCPESVLKLILGHIRNSGQFRNFINEFVDEKCPETKLFRSLSLLSKDISLSERETTNTYTYTLTKSVLKLILGHLCISGQFRNFVNEFVDEKCPETKLFRSLSLLSKDISFSERETTYTLTYTLTKSVPKVSRN